MYSLNILGCHGNRKLFKEKFAKIDDVGIFTSKMYFSRCYHHLILIYLVCTLCDTILRICLSLLFPWLPWQQGKFRYNLKKLKICNFGSIGILEVTL